MCKNSLTQGSLFLVLATMPVLQADTALLETAKIPVDYDFTGKPLPKWEAGSLIATDASAGPAVRFTVFDKSGSKIQEHLFQVEGAKYLTVRDYTRSADGTLGLCGSMVDFEGRSGSYLAFVHATDHSTHLVRMNPYQPMRITASANGTFWVAGYEMTTREPGSKPRTSLAEAVNRDAALFRNFDKTGKLLRSSVPQSAIKDPISLAQPGPLFTEIGNEMIWYTGHSSQLIAIAPDGSFTEVKELKLPENHQQTGFGISAKGEIIVSTLGNSSWSVLKLMPSRREWQSIAQGKKGDRSNLPILVIGAEGNSITAHGGGNRGIRTFSLVD